MKLSLQHKIVFLIVIIALLLSVSSIMINNSISKDIIDQNYKAKAIDLAETVAVVIDKDTAKNLRDSVMTKYLSMDKKDRVGSEKWGSDEFNKYIGKFEMGQKTKDFKALRNEVRAIQKVNDVDCIYISAIDVKSKSFIYLMDAALEDACPPGCFDPIYDVNKKLLTDPTVGFPPYITNTDEYGWLVTAGAAVYDKNNNVICYAMVDISMGTIREQQKKMLMYMVGVVLLLTVIICFLAILYVRRSMIKPITQLSDAAGKYSQNNAAVHTDFAKVSIRTGDELEMLATSMKQMEDDINSNISNLIAVSTELSEARRHADKMTTLANKDALTGIRNKLSYNNHMEDLQEQLENNNARFAIVVTDLNDLKTINDTYGHDKGDISIITLSNLVCDTFMHSAVFRIGGDEFAAIILNRDYTNIDSLMDVFAGKLEEIKNDNSLPPWEKISASIGYAVYNPDKDDDVYAVFRRADAIMYKYKRKMKAEAKEESENSPEQ